MKKFDWLTILSALAIAENTILMIAQGVVGDGALIEIAGTSSPNNHTSSPSQHK